MNRTNPLEETDLSIPMKLDQIETLLQGQLSGRIRDLTLVYRQPGVILRGFARTYYAKQLAQHALMREVDLPILANEIEVA